MNPILVIGVIILAVILWFVLTSLFKPLGNFLEKRWNKTVETMNEKDEKAAIEAEQKKIQAEGEAEATRIKAEAEADANKKIAESLTPELIEKEKIEKWDGSVPKVQGSNTSIVSMDE